MNLEVTSSLIPDADEDDYCGPAPERLGPLNFRRRRFVLHYIGTRDLATAYRAAGCEAATNAAARANACRLLRDPEVRAAVMQAEEVQIAALQEAVKVTLARVVAQLGAVAFADPRQLVDENGDPRRLDQIPDDLAAAIAGVDVTQHFGEDGPVTRTTKYKLLDRNRTLDMLMQHLNGYEKHQQAALSPLAQLLAGMKRSTVPVVRDVQDVEDVGTDQHHAVRGFATAANPPPADPTTAAGIHMHPGPDEGDE